MTINNTLADMIADAQAIRARAAKDAPKPRPRRKKIVVRPKGSGGISRELDMQDLQAIKMLSSGSTASEIGKKFGRSRNSILGAINRIRIADKKHCDKAGQEFWDLDPFAKPSGRAVK